MTILEAEGKSIKENSPVARWYRLNKQHGSPQEGGKVVNEVAAISETEVRSLWDKTRQCRNLGEVRGKRLCSSIGNGSYDYMHRAALFR